jgi:hypothetical protein
MKKFFTLFVCLILAASTVYAQKEQEVKTGAKMSGYVFGDYFYKVGGDTLVKAGSSQFSGNAKDDQAFNLRRMYLNFDYTFNEQFTGKIILEGGDKSLDANKRYGIFVKYAYAEWKEILPGAKLLVGIIPTSEYAAGLAEKGWIFRSVERTVIDKSGLATGADFGIGLYGKFDKEGLFNYTAMIGNGSGTAMETNKYKKYYLSLNAQPVKGLFAEVHFDFEPNANDLNKQTIKGLLFYKTDAFIIGFEGFQRTYTQAKTPIEVKSTPLGISAYASYSLGDNLKAFARFDNYNPNTENTTTGYSENFIVAGIDFMPFKDVHFIPNIWMTTFSKKTDTPKDKDADLVARITFFFNFK